MHKVYPLVMIGRRASGKTTLLSVLLGQSGFESSISSLNYTINTDDKNSRAYLIDIYHRILKQENAKPTGVSDLPGLKLYADIEAHRIPFSIPDVAGEHFEDTQVTDSIAEKTREELMKIVQSAGVLVIVIELEALGNKDLFTYTNQVGIVLSELKKDLYKGFIPPIIVAISKFDRHPGYCRDYSKQLELIDKLLQESEYLQQIKSVVSGAAGENNYAILPVSSFGGFEQKKSGDFILNFPPPVLRPSGLVEMLEIAFKKMLMQSHKIITQRPVLEYLQGVEKHKALEELKAFSPFDEITVQISESLRHLEPQVAELKTKRAKKYLSWAFLCLGVVAVLVLFSFLIIPQINQDNFINAGKSFVKNKLASDKLPQIKKWLKEAESFVASNKHIETKELVDLVGKVKNAYAMDFIEEHKQAIENAIEKAVSTKNKIDVCDALLDKADNQFVSNFITQKKSALLKKFEKEGLEEFLVKIKGLDIVKATKELREKLEQKNLSSDTRIALNEQLNKMDSQYYKETVEPRGIVVKEKLDAAKDCEKRNVVMKTDSRLTHAELIMYKTVCADYVSNFPNGLMTASCQGFLDWYTDFENNGVPCTIEFQNLDAYDIHYGDFEIFCFECSFGDFSPKMEYKDFEGKNVSIEPQKISYKSGDRLKLSLKYTDDDWSNDPEETFTCDETIYCLFFAKGVYTLRNKDKKDTTLYVKIRPLDADFYNQFPVSYRVAR